MKVLSTSYVSIFENMNIDLDGRYYLTLEARDQAGQGGDRATTTSIRVNVMDSDDLGEYWRKKLFKSFC